MSVQSITDIKQYLSFVLGKEDFALDVIHVREILEFSLVTRMPKTSDYMLGVINLRGSVVPVLDMRLKFGLPETEKTIDTCIIVVEISFEGEQTVVGALVDSVKEVFELEPQDIEPAPKIGTGITNQFIKGMGKKDDHFVIILDIDKVFSTEELTLCQEIGTENEIMQAGNE